MTETTVVGVNLTHLTEDGTTDPLSVLLLDLCTTAARLVQSPREYVGATAALTSLRDTVAGEIPETAALVTHVLSLLEQAIEKTKGA